ncbi:hypothetical protein JW978_00090 [Candidatus Dojkabacteria bacterium]|nr:hypothetical protein [Candidatus Dojkabacteria bacterium]
MKDTKNIYSLESVTSDLADIIGMRVLEYKRLMDGMISIPQVFVLTTQAFDTFLIENDLVDRILEQLARMETSQDSAARIAKRIQRQIVDAPIPNSIRSELKMYYRKLAGLGQAPLRIFPSPVNSHLEASMEIKGIESSFSFGFEDFLNDIKSNWASIFSEKSLIYWERIQYEGPLSMGLLIMKSPIAEISAVVTTKNPLLQSNQIEINAILGTVEPFLRGELVGDRYVCNIENEEILEKSVVEQSWMAVYKLTKRNYQENKLKISNVWKSRQKLSDKNIQHVIEYTKLLKKIIDYPFEAVFQLELGKILLIEVREIEIVTALSESGSHLDDLKKKIESEIEEAAPEQLEINEEPQMVEELGEEAEVDQASTIDDADEVNESELPEIDITKIDTEKEIKTIIEVAGTDWNLPDYVRYHKNLDLLINRSGKDFFAGQSLSDKNAGVSEKLIRYLEDVLSHSHENVVYQLNTNASSLEIELEAVRKVRNKKHMKNLWIAVTGIRNEKEYMEIKKKIALAKLRRSSTLKILAVIDNAASAMVVGDIIEASTDGLIYNLDQIVENTIGFYKSGETPIEGIKEILKASLKTASDHKADTYVIGNALEKDFDIKEVIKMGATGIGTKLADTIKTKEKVKKVSSL